MQEGNIERLRGLSAPDTRVRDPEGLTLLHWATDRGHEDIVTMLVDSDPDLINMQVTNMARRELFSFQALLCMGLGFCWTIFIIDQ